MLFDRMVDRRHGIRDVNVFSYTLYTILSIVHNSLVFTINKKKTIKLHTNSIHATWPHTTPKLHGLKTNENIEILNSKPWHSARYRQPSIRALRPSRLTGAPSKSADSASQTPVRSKFK